MTRKIARFTTLGLAAILLAALVAGCGGASDDTADATPTPNIQLTIQASIPTVTPTPPPTPEPTPNIQATLAAMLAAQQPTPAPPTATPVPPPTATPVPPPTATPVPAPTATPEPAPTAAPADRSPASGPPAVITGKVTIGGATAPAKTVVYAKPKSAGLKAISAETNDKGIYNIQIFFYEEVYDLWVGGTDSEKDTALTKRGGLQGIALSVAQ